MNAPHRKNSRQQNRHKQAQLRSRLRMFETLESRNLMATLVEVRLDALALDGVTPITHISRGSEFLLRGQASDLSSANPQGALQIYSDIAYNSSEITPAERFCKIVSM